MCPRQYISPYRSCTSYRRCSGCHYFFKIVGNLLKQCSTLFQPFAERTRSQVTKYIINYQRGISKLTASVQVSHFLPARGWSKIWENLFESSTQDKQLPCSCPNIYFVYHESLNIFIRYALNLYKCSRLYGEIFHYMDGTGFAC